MTASREMNYRVTRRIKEKRRINRLVYIWSSLIGIMIIVFCIKGTAYSMEKSSGIDKAMDSYYHQMEGEYVENIRAILDEYGYQNAGVMLTKIINVEGKREYVLNIHHRRFGKDIMRDNKLTSAIEKMGSPVADSSINIMTTN